MSVFVEFWAALIKARQKRGEMRDIPLPKSPLCSVHRKTLIQIHNLLQTALTADNHKERGKSLDDATRLSASLYKKAKQ